MTLFCLISREFGGLCQLGFRVPLVPIGNVGNLFIVISPLIRRALSSGYDSGIACWCGIKCIIRHLPIYRIILSVAMG